MLRDIICDVLIDELCYIYCESCMNKEKDECDDCHRKNMKWKISRSEADRIAGNICEVYSKSLNVSDQL